ncbi:MAG: heme lyase CcmF/NrfE family subunit [Chloroflexi bacterium]|nr:heme lyase CcmF/NrfE family subunit [Chloroflexota bacterium]
MIVYFGYGALVITFLLSLYGIGAAVYGALNKREDWAESARLAMLLTFPLISVSALVMIYLLATGRYEVAFVYNVTQNAMPLYLRVTALWGGQSGSLLFWSWLMSAFFMATTLRKWDRDREFLPWVTVVALVTLAFFIGMNIFIENPFERFWATPGGEVQAMFQPANSSLIVPRDGRGLNPLLRHPGMIIHPPMLYLGFVSFVVPYAFAVAALVTGRTDDRWIRLTRRWTLVAWLFLSLGLILGGRWAYDVLGWGGYWGWDPVEIAAFMPWLSGTAFLHSVMIQEKKGMFKRWNMVLIILTYSLVIFGTFLTRSGVLSSVHAFAQSAVGPLFFGFIGITFLITLSLLLWRWNDLHSEGEMHSLLSRESLFLINNLLFMGILAVCFWGVLFPLISELFTGQKVTVGPPFYERATGPQFAALLFLMGVAPLSAWGHSTIKTLGRAIWKPTLLSAAALAAIWASGVRSPWALLGFWLVVFTTAITLFDYVRAVWRRHKARQESLPAALVHLTERNRRRYGGYIIHIGIVLMALGVIGIEMFQTETQGTIRPGESLSLSGYTVTFRELADFDTADGRNVARAVVEVTRGGKVLGELYPRRDYYYAQQQPMTIPGVRSTMEDDLYVLLVDWQPISADGATFKIYHNPLVNWLWLGGLVFIVGTFVAAWPDKDPAPARARVQLRREAASGA